MTPDWGTIRFVKIGANHASGPSAVLAVWKSAGQLAAGREVPADGGFGECDNLVLAEVVELADADGCR